jgi:hypothetical protein
MTVASTSLAQAKNAAAVETMPRIQPIYAVAKVGHDYSQNISSINPKTFMYFFIAHTN